MPMTDPLLNDNGDLATALDILDKWVARQVKQRHQPGLAIGVVYDGALLWGAGYGFADVEAGAPVTLEPTEEEDVFILCEAGQSNETLRFERDAEGHVTRKWERGEYSSPVGKGRKLRGVCEIGEVQ